ncbi:hypothetical protein [Candidatus Poriferisocius sp.]|uniref:hypothetical protein n=1 Tax=Candidatus Poriferisocius sp. TaxID=3101276 RepID=UPI003B525CA2
MSIRPQNAPAEYSQTEESQFRADLARQIEDYIENRGVDRGDPAPVAQVSGAIRWVSVNHVVTASRARWNLQTVTVPDGMTLKYKVENSAWTELGTVLPDVNIRDVKATTPFRFRFQGSPGDEALSLTLGAFDSDDALVDVASFAVLFPITPTALNVRVTAQPTASDGRPEGTLYWLPETT